MAKLSAIALAAMLLCGSLVTAQVAQERGAANQPSRYIWYEIAKVNAGKYPVYAKIVSQFREVVNTTTPDVYWIAGTPITGESDHITFVSFHDNMASVEKMITAFEKADKALNLKNANLPAQVAEAAGGSHWVLAEYDKEISYRPDMVPMANTTWWLTELVSLKPGCNYELKDVAQQVISLHQKAGDNEHWIAYNIRGGYPQPSVLFVMPLRSLADRDQEPPTSAKEVFESPMVRQMFTKFDKECVTHVETAYTRVQPSLSRPPQALIAANPDYWTIKEEAAPVTAKKGKAKKGIVEPTALKEKEETKK
jgi:hypothetical protein